MKHILIILLSLLFAYQQIDAQDSTRLKSFREKLLPQYIVYFNSAKLTEKGLLELSATDKYMQLSAIDKKAIMTNITSSWREPLVLVKYGEKTDMWGWSGETGNTELLDGWDMKQSPSLKTTAITPHLPWFFYVGDLMSISQNNINFSFNTRVGCFMFDNKWDFAGTFAFGFIASGTGENTTTTGLLSYGIMGRKRFIIPNNKLKFTPSIGGQLLANSVGGNTTYTSAVILGISWYVGIGSIDIDFSIGTQTSGMGGYTVAPNILRR